MSEREILPCAEATFCDEECHCATGLKVFGVEFDAHFYCDTEALADAINEAYAEQKPHHCDRYVDPSCPVCWPDGGMREQPEEDNEGEGHGP